MPRIVRVSVDYDNVLTEDDVQDYVKRISDGGFDVWVVSSREDTKANRREIYKVSSPLGVMWEHVVLTDGFKFKAIKKIQPVWHLDDDWIDLSMIKSKTKTVAIRYSFNPEWQKQCNEALKRHIDKYGLRDYEL